MPNDDNLDSKFALRCDGTHRRVQNDISHNAMKCTVSVFFSSYFIHENYGVSIHFRMIRREYSKSYIFVKKREKAIKENLMNKHVSL